MKPLFAALLLIACAPLALAQGTYTQIDYPGATATTCWGINTAGEISGSYEDASGKWHGYLLNAGVYTSVDYPGAAATQFTGLNDQGLVTGVATTPTTGFVYDATTQQFENVDYPGGTNTVPTAIGNDRIIVGYYDGGAFEVIGTKYTKIRPPHTTTGAAYGITNSGVIIGEAANSEFSVLNFSFFKDTYKGVVVPGISSAEVLGINPSGNSLTGDYTVSQVIYGFVYEDKITQQLQFPAATSTFGIGINDSGVVVGQFGDSSGLHGFMWTPPAAEEQK